MRTRALTAAAALALAICPALSSCSTGIESEGSGPAKVIDAPVHDPADLKIAYFSAGTSNSYLQASIDEAKKAGRKLGADLDVFDGQFNAQTQYDQMQQALTSGKYNAFVVEPNDGNLVCDLLTQQAPEKKVLVSVFNLPICGRAKKLGERTHQPGTLTYVGGQTLDVYRSWVRSVKRAHPHGAKIALISGPDLNANTLSFFSAAKAFKPSEGYRVVSRQTTDYSTPKAFDAAQTILHAHPDLDVIMSNFSGMTRGVVAAADGKKVQVYDFGGDRWALKQVADGSLTGSVMMLPRLETRRAIEAVADYVKGKRVPPFIDLTESGELPGTPFATKHNVGEFTPQY
ncbi:sugar ABC transporter substrate-binding protein [Streptomyces asiaticus]